MEVDGLPCLNEEILIASDEGDIFVHLSRGYSEAAEGRVYRVKLMLSMVAGAMCQASYMQLAEIPTVPIPQFSPHVLMRPIPGMAMLSMSHSAKTSKEA
ncbi:unnamed protein product [Dovyalis caffra]|uniref:Uncharacterized protein n=1 Tax=Dovyalis caffra TaxID=77055 RepID=A0AAV1R281_9ROSI|nr:unnamed protein product [Dovyalis caffra]